jgi:N6-L-threonylcarbamoyladenine synthase
MLVMGIESSCDETSVALYDGRRMVHRTTTQEVHRAWGGVVPELASRDHLRLILPMMTKVLEGWGAGIEDIEGVAATAGPGLVGALLVGLNMAKGLAMGSDIPLIAVNHLEGHLWVHQLNGEPMQPPFLSLIVSGGHTELVRVDGFGKYEILGRTRDDAAGEALDKLGVLFGLKFPAGPEIDRLSRAADRHAFDFPRGMIHDGLDFSFSGLKTAVRVYLDQDYEGVMSRRDDVLCSVQEAVVDVLLAKISRAVEQTGIRNVSVSGGVAANTRLRELADAQAKHHGYRIFFPERAYCTDNAAMIAWVGRKRLLSGERSRLDEPVQPGWRLEILTPPPQH